MAEEEKVMRARRERSNERGEFSLLKEQTDIGMPMMSKEIESIQKKERMSHVQ